MKKFYIFKLIQLGVFILCLAFILKFILRMNGLNSFETGWITTEKAYMVILVTAAVFFFGMIIDLFCLQKLHIEQQGIDKITYLDPVTGGLNRFSCDMMLKNYDTDRIRPMLACFIFTITNLEEVNEDHSREEGNMLIKNFNDILSAVTGERGIVARNSPNHYLVMLKNADEKEAKKYVDKVEEAVLGDNTKGECRPIKYDYGMALNCVEKKPTISQLIALAQQRINGYK